MGLIEFTILLLLILTIGHYIVAWSIYLEKKLELVCSSWKLVISLNPLYPNINMHILYTVLQTFPKVLTKKMFNNPELLKLVIIFFNSRNLDI